MSERFWLNDTQWLPRMRVFSVPCPTLGLTSEIRKPPKVTHKLFFPDFFLGDPFRTHGGEPKVF